MQTRSVFLPAVLLLCAASSVAMAADTAAPNLAPGRAMLRQVGSTDKELGAGIGIGPSYLGNSTYRWGAGVFIEDNWANGVFVSSTDGIGWRFLETPSGLSMAASIGASMGRKESDAKHSRLNRLRGMGDVEVGAQANLFLNYDSGPFHVNTAVHQVLAGRRGTGVDLSVAYDLLSDRDDLVRADVGISYANRSLMQTFFGVTAEQAARSPNPAYEARAGIAGGGASLTWRHAFTPNWIGSLGVGVINLRGSAASSPLTSTRTGGVGNISIAYRF
jgi:outer membrane scaffolding protein for murein synthesis (MipA/OmpV family)